MSGLPGTGKSTLSAGLAERLRGVWVRIDTIEQAIRDSDVLAGDVGPAGYFVGYGIAATNLRLGHVVVADSVNPIAITRDAWRDVARAAGARLVEVEVVCSDPAEHRRPCAWSRHTVGEIAEAALGVEHQEAPRILLFVNKKKQKNFIHEARPNG